VPRLGGMAEWIVCEAPNESGGSYLRLARRARASVQAGVAWASSDRDVSEVPDVVLDVRHVLLKL